MPDDEFVNGLMLGQVIGAATVTILHTLDPTSEVWTLLLGVITGMLIILVLIKVLERSG